MADDEAIAAFFAAYDLGPDAMADGAPRLWFMAVTDGVVVFAVADGENVDGGDLRGIAGRAIDALREAIEDAGDVSFALEEE